jgi:hypothetical protein
MKLSNAVLAGIAGTTAFTVFSYIVAEQSNRSYKQPKLIGKMIDRSSPELDRKQAEFTGWLTHYLIGIGFAMIYKQIIDASGIKPRPRNGAIAGAISGIPAALAWHTTLKLHHKPPRKTTWDYYAELVMGHIVFGATCFWIFKKRKSK